MRILLSGSTGLIGRATAELLRNQGHEIARLVRPDSSEANKGASAHGASDVTWDPKSGGLGPGADGANAVVHLAGASIAGKRWTDARKRVLVDSRVAATRNLVQALGKLAHPPRVFVGASAIGYYGDRGDEQLTEGSAPGNDFLAGICRDWEAESARAQAFGARVVTPRFGIVLANDGGALRQMLLPFRFGAGGPIGSGEQWMSWIALNDVLRIIAFALTNDRISGAVNAAAPHAVRNREFSKELGRALHRPAILPAPAFALRLALGEMADALLLASQHVLPDALERAGYQFLYPELGPALAAILHPGK